MQLPPKEVLLRQSFHEIGNYFAELFSKKTQSGQVPICVEDSQFTKFYFVPCNEWGYPLRPYIDFLEMETPLAWVKEGEELDFATATYNKTTLTIDRPILSQQFNFDYRPIVFMWNGRILNKKVVPIEQLNVAELMKLAQESIKLREGLIIDEAMKNKLFI